MSRHSKPLQIVLSPQMFSIEQFMLFAHSQPDYRITDGALCNKHRQRKKNNKYQKKFIKTEKKEENKKDKTSNCLTQLKYFSKIK